MQNYNKIISALAISAIGLLVFQIFTYSVYAQSSDCHDRFIFAWHTLNPVLECLNDNIGGGGVTSINPTAGLGSNATTGNVSIFPKWELLCQNTLASSANSITCANFTSRSYLILHAEQTVITSNVRVGIVFNLDTGNNYSYRFSANGNADTTAVNTNNCQLGNPGDGQTHSIYAYIDNNVDTDNKVMFVQSGSSGVFGAGTTPGRIEETCKWDNTTDPIDTISIVRVTGTGSYGADTKITVWGYD